MATWQFHRAAVDHAADHRLTLVGKYGGRVGARVTPPPGRTVMRETPVDASVHDRSLADATTFRRAMSMLAAPVTIVTTRDDTGCPWGFTASAVTAVSLNPPLLLVGIAHDSSCHAAFRGTDELVVNVLGEHHRDVATRFATHGADRFAGGGFVDWPGTALPCLIDANACYRCRTWRILTVGDHDLVVAGLVELRVNAAGGPLMWYQRGFHGTALS
jgi:flavin reductase ActVB